jgi:hypothetical protein
VITLPCGSCGTPVVSPSTTNTANLPTCVACYLRRSRKPLDLTVYQVARPYELVIAKDWMAENDEEKYREAQRMRELGGRSEKKEAAASRNGHRWSSGSLMHWLAIVALIGVGIALAVLALRT